MVPGNGIVHLEDLKKNKRIYIKINSKSKRVNLYKLKYLPKRLVWIGTKNGKGIKNPKFPLNFNSKNGFIIIAAILGDGSFNKDFRLTYNNNEKSLLNKVKSSVMAVFGGFEDLNIIKYKNIFKLTLPVISGIIIEYIGLKRGRKTLNNPKIPKFILNGEREKQIAFLKQFSDDEGSPQINIPYSYSIRFSLCIKRNIKKRKIPPNLLIDLKKIVENLNYKTSRIYLAGEYMCKQKLIVGNSWAFDIQGKDSLEKFKREIGFSIKRRQKKLIKGLKAIKKIQLGSKKMYEKAIKCFIVVYEKDGYVTKHSLANEANIPLRNSLEWLRKLNKKNLIKIKGGNVYIHTGKNICGLNGRTPNEYILNN